VARYSYGQIALHWVVVLLVIEQYFTSAAMFRVHAYRPLGRHADPSDLTLHTVHTRVGLVILALVAVRLVLRLRHGAPQWTPPLPHWRKRLSAGVQYGLYGVLLAQALTGAIASYLWWPMSAVHNGLFWALLLLLAMHLGGAANLLTTRPRETMFRIAALRLSSQLQSPEGGGEKSISE
jgi:cytochrome b561